MTATLHTAAENIVNEVVYLERMERALVPAHLRDGLVRYLVHHIRPGYFLTAVLQNDLRAAIAHGDAASLTWLPELIRFLENDVPLMAWGSPRLVDVWLDPAGVAPREGRS